MSLRHKYSLLSCAHAFARFHNSPATKTVDVVSEFAKQPRLLKKVFLFDFSFVYFKNADSDA